MVIVKPDTTNKQVIIVCQRVNDLFHSTNFWDEVAQHKELFHLGNIDGVTLRRFYEQSNVVVSVGTFRSRFPSKSNGYTLPSMPNNMWLNTRHLNRSEASIGATVVHETVHCVDNTQPYYNFSHGDNSYNHTKDDCAPIWLADVGYKHLSGGIKSEMFMPIEAKFITSQGLPFYEKIFA